MKTQITSSLRLPIGKEWWFFSAAVVFSVFVKTMSFVSSWFGFFLIVAAAVLILFFLSKYKNSAFDKVRKVKVNPWLVGFLSCLVGVFFNTLLVSLKIYSPFSWTERAEPVGPNFLMTFNVGGVNLVWLIYFYFLGPVTEEFIHRKYLLGILMRKSVPAASVLVSLFFIAGHPIDLWRNFYWVVELFFFSMQANYLYSKTGNIFFPILMHIATNASIELIRPIFFSQNIPALLRFLLLFAEMVIFIVLVVWLNLYLKRKSRAAKIQRQKTDWAFNCFCYVVLALFFVSSLFWI